MDERVWQAYDCSALAERDMIPPYPATVADGVPLTLLREERIWETGDWSSRDEPPLRVSVTQATFDVGDGRWLRHAALECLAQQTARGAAGRGAPASSVATIVMTLGVGREDRVG